MTRKSGSRPLVYNLEHADYITHVCGSLDRLAEVFAQLDFDRHEMRVKGLPSDDRQQDFSSEIQLASASLVYGRPSRDQVCGDGSPSRRRCQKSRPTSSSLTPSIPKSNRILTL